MLENIDVIIIVYLVIIRVLLDFRDNRLDRFDHIRVWTRAEVENDLNLLNYRITSNFLHLCLRNWNEELDLSSLVENLLIHEAVHILNQFTRCIQETCYVRINQILVLWLVKMRNECFTLSSWMADFKETFKILLTQPLFKFILLVNNLVVVYSSPAIDLSLFLHCS